MVKFKMVRLEEIISNYSTKHGDLEILLPTPKEMLEMMIMGGVEKSEVLDAIKRVKWENG